MDLLSAFSKWVLAIFIIKYIGPHKLNITQSNLILNFQLCFSFKPDPCLRLVIKRVIEATVIEIYFHRWMLQSTLHRLLKVYQI